VADTYKMKFKISWFLLLGLPLVGFSQSIVNTESMSTKTDSTFVLTSSLEGNYTTGNIELIQINTANQLAYKRNKNIIRFFFNYEYISADKETISSDYTSQLRYSYALKNNSIYSFIQGQKAVSLSLNSRYLAGIGYRHRIINKDQNYLDAAFGPFYENEMYLRNSLDARNVINYRTSFSMFSNLKLTENIQINTVLYYQLKVNNFKDYRIYLEPKVIYNFKNIKSYVTLRYRYHSTPYIDIKNTDLQLLFGITYDLGFN